ncbi:unknown protein [Microcystis aeruginosa NIES-843]|uniref:Uncharacterized protein n=1 Tax=Microcystis aeruginosa (strain NIES-843 / IAM M-2473) TaxID=449447 RepID=B0JIF6_MICAN|nr:unknown protein [Microcystis aeruginosa NIES-843]
MLRIVCDGPVVHPETSYSHGKVKFEKFGFKPYLRKNFRSLHSVVFLYYTALTQAL